MKKRQKKKMDVKRHPKKIPICVPKSSIDGEQSGLGAQLGVAHERLVVAAAGGVLVQRRHQPARATEVLEAAFVAAEVRPWKTEM